MSKDKIIKWGIIGIGKIAHKFASDLQPIENAELLAVASTSLERATDFAQKFGAKYIYNQYEAIFQTPDLDAIYIATTHATHAEHTILCLNNKMPVLCEKPLAINALQVEKMLEAAQENDTFLMEAMWTRFLPATKKLLNLIFEENAIGKIKTIHADFGFLAPFIPEKRIFNPDLGGGALLDIGIYPAYLSLLLLGYPSEIQSVSTFSETGVDETTSFILKYNNDATAVLNCSFVATTRTDAIIYGENGYIYIHPRFIETKKITLYKKDAEPVDYTFERETIGYNYEIEEVNNCLRENKKQSDLMPHSMSRQLINLLDAIRQKSGIVYAADAPNP